MAVESYAEGMSYEIFMKRAFQTNDTSKPGIHLSNMKNLIDAENGESWVSHLPKANKQLEKVRGYMNKGFEKLIKTNKDLKVKSLLADLQVKTLQSGNAVELCGILRRALDVTKQQD